MSDSFVTLWNISCQAPLSMGFSQARIQEKLSFPSPGEGSNPEIKPVSPALAGGFFTTEPPGKHLLKFSSVQSLRLTLCDPMNYSMQGLPVHHQLLEFTQTHFHQVDDAIQPSYPLPSPSSPAPNPSQHQSLFQWVNSSHEVAKVLEFQLQHQSFQWTPRTDLL